MNKYVGRAVVKDLIRGDSALAELGVLKSNLEFVKMGSAAKDNIISLKQQEIDSYKEKEKNWYITTTLKDSQLEIANQTSKQLAKDLKKEKRKGVFVKVVGTVIIGAITYAYITK